MIDHSIPIDELRASVSYDPETGLMFWRERPAYTFVASDRSSEHKANNWNARFAGKPAFNVPNGEGRLTGHFQGRRLDAARVSFALYHGRWPVNHIDHIDGCITNNRPDNLRDVAASENMKNAARRKDNSSGVTGVRKRRKSWIAEIFFDGRRKYLGRFATKDEAIAARKKAELELGFHPNHGRNPISIGGE